MSYPVYMVPAGDVLPIFFATYAGSTGASITLTGLAVTDIEVYKDGGITQRASDAGYVLLDTDGIDLDGITGIHGVSIDTGDNTDASFYTTGAWFHVVVSAVTVDTQTVNFVAAAFRIMAAESAAGVAKVDVTHYGGSAGTFASGIPSVNAAQLSGDSTAADNAEAFFDGTGYAGTNNVIPLVTTTTTVTNQVTANVTALSGDTTAADNAEAYFDGSGYKDPDNEFIIRSSTAQAGAATTITLDSGASAVDDFYNNTYISLTGGTGAGQARFISDYVGSTKVATINAAWATNPDNTSVFIVWPFSTIPGASAPTAAEVADAVWDEATTSHTTSGTFGEQLKTDVDAILADTGTDGVLVSSGTGTGQLSITSGVVNANAVQISGDSAAADVLENELDGTAGSVPTRGIVDQGTAQSASSTTIVLRSAAAFADDELVGAIVFIVSATAGAGQTRLITDYVSSTDTATVDQWTTTPSGTIVYKIFATPPASTSLPAAVNVVQISGDSTAADNAEAFFDGNGYAGTGNVIPTVTTVTNAVSANVTQVSGDTTAADNLEAMLDGTGGVTLSAVLGANAVTATSIATDAITAAKIAANAITSSELADGAITAAKFGAGAIDATAVADGAIDAATFAAGAITATVIATGAIDADALAANAIDLIWDEAISGHTTQGTFGETFSGAIRFTVQASSTTTVVNSNLAEATDDHYNGRTLVFITGALAGQATSISDYNGTTKALTVVAMTEAPATNDRAVIV